MAHLAVIWDGLSSALLIPAAFLFVLTVVVFVHEMGHFLVARWCGVTVKTFSIGFGPEIAGFEDRHGTRWRLAWIPLGGYVKFLGDENAASVPSKDALDGLTAAERAGAFQNKTVAQRAAIVAAGPAANYLLAIAIFALVALLYGVTLIEPRVGKVVSGTPAEAAGFLPGDLVVQINETPIDQFSQLQHIVSTSPGRVLTFVVDRDGRQLELIATPQLREHEDPIAGKHNRVVIGIQASESATKVVSKDVSPIEALQIGVQKTSDITVATLSYIRDLVLGHQAADQIGGPIRIADVSGQVAKLGVIYLVQLIGVISVSIGLLNLFPIPLLDGGHLMYYAVEAVQRRPLSERAQEIGFRIGLALVLSLMVFATINDLPILQKWFSWAG